MKTAQEWEQEFDLLYNGNNSNIAPFLDSYEKSVFLTMAQEQVVKTLYSGGAIGQNSFENTELLRRSLDSLMRETTFMSSDGTPTQFGKSYELPKGLANDEVLYIVYEELTEPTTGICKDSHTISVVPTTHDVFYKTRNNPFRGANERRALRLDIADDKVEIVTPYDDYKYFIRYIKKPYPIILEPLTGGDQINGQTQPLTNICELDESIHRLILETAVQFAEQTAQR